MAGATSNCVYTDDNGVEHQLRLPSWHVGLTDAAGDVLQTCTAPTTQPPMDKGVKPRRRYIASNATGRETPVIVLSGGTPIYTSGKGTPVIKPTWGAAPGSTNNATLQGRTGEKRRG